MVEFHPEARLELLSASAWYDQRRSGLGDSFIDVVQDAAALVTEHPEIGLIFPVPGRKTPPRQTPISGFPYLLVYLPYGQTTWVLAVAHTSRRPGYWTHRIH